MRWCLNCVTCLPTRNRYSIEDAATGLKTFAYLYRLIEKGHITPETVLIIDEPEVHLHPKWVVEFARILVHLHKQVGVKILLASHDPDMVAALQSIGEKEELGEKLNFYIAKRSEENKHQFDFYLDRHGHRTHL